MVPIRTLALDEDHWDKPQEFRPERFLGEGKPGQRTAGCMTCSLQNTPRRPSGPAAKANVKQYAYIPFGAGPRQCPGMKFAMQEAKLTLIRMLQQFRVQADPLLTPKQVGYLESFTIQPDHEVFLRFEPRA